ncbi:MAG: hypothetical protein AAF911_11735 [Planctomycetota bacterium]
MPDSTASVPPVSRRRSFFRFTGRWLWRGTKTVALLLLLGLLVGVGWITWVNHQGQQAITDTVREIVDEGGLPPEPEVIPAEQNGARYLRAAAALMIESDTLRADWPVVGSADWPEFGVSLNADQIDTLVQMVELSQGGYAAVEQARAYDVFDFDPQRNLGLNQELKILSDSRRLSRWLQIRHLLLTEQNEPAAAAEVIGDVLLVAESLRQDETLVAGLVDLSIVALGYSLVEDTLSRHQLPDAALARMQQALLTATDGADTLGMMKRETQRDLARWIDPDEALNRAMFHGFYRDSIWEEVRKAIHEELTGTPYDFVESWWDDWAERISLASARLCPGRTQLHLVKEYDYLLQALAQVESNGEVHPSLIEEVDDTEFFTPNAVAASLRSFRQGRTVLLCHIYGLEAERYRLREGTWPTSIDQIELTALPPVDVWGTRLAVAKTDQGFKVYSFGDNGRDDGGLDRWDDYDWADYPDGEPDDWNMMLLDPEIRGTLEPQEE